MYVVWEPIRGTDFTAPATWALSRASDRRVRQYWDKNHALAKQMAADARPPQPEQECCLQGDILWDLAAVYPKGAVWEERMPPATLFNGAVVDIRDAIEAALAR